jgi:hypothetical protein
MRFEPHDAEGRSRFTGKPDYSEHAHLTRKANAARSRGAKAVLIVNPPHHHPGEAELRPFVPVAARFDTTSIPMLSITRAVAERIVGRDLGKLQDQIDDRNAPQSFATDKRVSGKVDLIVERTPAHNVVAYLPGNGPDAGEAIVVGAHYDHIGRGGFASRKPGQELIHNGADDNASGTAAVLAVARELAASDRKRNRGVIFVLFTAEESGLNGSRHFVNHPPVPTEKMVAMINLDMVGRLRDNRLSVGGGGTRAAFAPLLKRLDDASPVNFKSIGEGGLGPSDQQSFALKRVPVLFFFTGLHAQYHHPDDDAPRINFDGLAKIVGITRDAALALDVLPREPYVDAFDKRYQDTGIGERASQPDPHATTQPGAEPTTQASPRMGRAALGVIPDYGSDQSTGGVRIGGAMPDSPAAKAGLAEGDVLVGWNEQPIQNLYDLTDRLRESAPGDEVTLAYERGGQRATTRVRLAERRSGQ